MMIYLVEDDESIRELVIYTLKSQGFEAKGFERPSLFWKELEKEHPSLLLLDVMLPEEDGISILKKLRVRPDTRKLPIIMLTARGSEYDTVIGLDSGGRRLYSQTIPNDGTDFQNPCPAAKIRGSWSGRIPGRESVCMSCQTCGDSR